MKKLLIISFLCIWSAVIFAQKSGENFTLTGTVYDERGEALIGVTIYKKDSPGIGTTTNLEGQFSLNVSLGDKLVLTFLGYDPYEYLVLKKEADIKISLNPTSYQIEEAVVVGMGTQRKISIVGAVTNVDVSELQTPATSLTNMMGGRIPGVISLQTSGEPGKNISEFWVRGIGTFGAGSSALVLIDGLEGDLSRVDPADVESFSVLKDASATAVYGVRGANGVVLVTTKRGLEDKLRITARANMTVSYLNRMPEYLDGYQYAKLANEARAVRGETELYSPIALDLIQTGLDPDNYPNVNWQDEIMNRTSLQQTYYVNARGGGSIARYFLSLGTSNESAAYKQDKSSKYSADVGYQTYNYRANIDIDMTKTTNLYFGADGFLSEKAEPGNANTDYLWSSQQKLTPLTIPTIYSNGQLPAFGPNDEYSPYVMLNHTGMSKVKKYTSNVTLALKQDLSMLTKGLSVRAQVAYSTIADVKEIRSILPKMYYSYGLGPSFDGTEAVPLISERVTGKPAEYKNEQNQFYKLHFETAADYTKLVDEIHRFSGLLYYYQSEEQWLSWARVDDKPYNDYKNDASMAVIPLRYQGVSGRFTYGLKDTYFIDLNFGYTGSGNFQQGRRFGFFPAAALGWVATNYDFMKDHASWLDFLKIRASYGTVGNDRITNKRFPYLTLVDVTTSGGPWGSKIGTITERQVGADNLKWEVAKKFDIGIEGELFNRKVSFVVDYFNDDREGIFQQRKQIPDYIGLTELPFGNVGSMRSYGSDGNISFFHKINDDMSFTIRGNYTYSKNKIKNWEEVDQKYSYQSVTGWPHNSYRGYIALGLFKDEEDVQYSPIQNFGSQTPLPGDIKYKDINGDGKIDEDDKVALSYSNYPKLMYGFGGEFNYKKFTLGILFKGTGNTDFYHVKAGHWDADKNDGMGYVPFLKQQLGNVLEIIANQENRWTPASYSGDPSTENPNARFPRLSYGKVENNIQPSTFWHGNSRYLRLQEVNLNYNLIGKWMKPLGLSSIDLQFVGSNLLVWDSVKLWDPEQADSNGSQYPIPARFAFQMYLNF